MTDKDILMEVHGDVKTLMADSVHLKKGQETIFDILNGEGGVATQKNGRDINWIWIIMSGSIVGVVAALGFLYSLI